KLRSQRVPLQRLDEAVDDNMTLSPHPSQRAVMIAVVRVRVMVEGEMIMIVVEVMIVVAQAQHHVAVAGAPDGLQLPDQTIESHGMLLRFGALGGSGRFGRCACPTTGG